MNTKIEPVTKIKNPKMPSKKKIGGFDYEDVDASLRFREEKKRQKPNNWRKYLEMQENDED